MIFIPDESSSSSSSIIFDAMVDDDTDVDVDAIVEVVDIVVLDTKMLWL